MSIFLSVVLTILSVTPAASFSIEMKNPPCVPDAETIC